MNYLSNKLAAPVGQFLMLIIITAIFFPLVTSAQAPVTTCTCKTTRFYLNRQELLKTESFQNITKNDCEKKNAPYISVTEITHDKIVCTFSGPENFIPDETEKKKPSIFEPNVSLPGTKFKAGQEIPVTNNLMGEYISGLYKFFVGIAGILAVVMISIGGLLWLFSGGSPDKISKAKEIIIGAVVGLILALGSYLILFTINPKLVDFSNTIPVVLRVDLAEELEKQRVGTDPASYRETGIPNRPGDCWENVATKECENNFDSVRGGAYGNAQYCPLEKPLCVKATRQIDNQPVEVSKCTKGEYLNCCFSNADCTLSNTCSADHKCGI